MGERTDTVPAATRERNVDKQDALLNCSSSIRSGTTPVHQVVSWRGRRNRRDRLARNSSLLAGARRVTSLSIQAPSQPRCGTGQTSPPHLSSRAVSRFLTQPYGAGLLGV